MGDLLTKMEFWSALIALIAVVLSQLPPARTWFSKPKLDVELHDQLSLGHTFGIPNLQVYVSMLNASQRPVRVRRTIFQISTESGKAVTLRMVSHFPTAGSATPVVVFPFTVGPSQEWSHIVNAATELDVSSDRRLSEMRTTVLQSFQNAKNGYESWKAGPRTTMPPVPAADLAVMEKARAEFRQNFIWQSGEFRLVVEVETDKGTFKSGTHRFTVFEGMEVSLTSQVNGYAMGHGLLPDLPISGVTTKLRASS